MRTGDFMNVTDIAIAREAKLLASHKDFEIITDAKNRAALHKRGKDKNILLSGPLWVAGQFRNRDGKGWGKLLQFVNRDGNKGELLLQNTRLEGDKTEIFRQLQDSGLFIVSGNEARKHLYFYISASSAPERYTSVTSTGWHDKDFVLNSKTYGDNKYVIENADLQKPQEGCLHGWQTNVAKYCANNSRLMFAACVGFSSPLLKLASAESGGFHYRGSSSVGKTKAINVASSVFGVGVQSWRATDNGLEGVAARHSDIGLCLDEIGLASGKIVGDCAYMLANGQGKQRSKTDGRSRKVMEWRLNFMSTGEITLADHMSESGVKVRAGQEIRFLNIEADAGKGLGIFEDLHEFSSASKLADHIHAMTEKHNGHAGPALVEYLVSNREESNQLIEETYKHFNRYAKLSDNEDGQVLRAARRFALVAAAGEIATEAGITKWDSLDVTLAAVTCFQQWRKSWSPAGSREAQRAIEQVRAFIQTQGSRLPFHDAPEAQRMVHNCAGFDSRQDEYWIFPTTFQNEVCAGLDHKTVAKALDQREYLVSGKAGFMLKRRVNSTQSRFYVISKKVLEANDDD